MVANLDFKTEFKALVTLIQSTWIGVDTTDVRAALLDAFNAGLHDGRFWCDQYINYRVGAVINKPSTELCPLYQRNEAVDVAYDALCILASNISTALSLIEQTQMRYPKWRYCHQMDNLMSMLRDKYSLKGITPRQMPEVEQQALINAYEGFRADGSRTLPTPVKLSYSDAMYSKQEQGMSFARTLISAVYSHGLACAQEFNDRSLVNVLTPIYQKYRDMPFCVSNGELLIEIAKEAEFFQIIEAISPFDFRTETDYAAALNAHQAYQTKIASMSEQARQQHEKAQAEASSRFLDELLAEIKSEESVNDDTQAARDALVESFRDRMTQFVVEPF